MKKQIIFFSILSALSLVILILAAEFLIRWSGAAPEVVYIKKWRMRLAANPKIGYEFIPLLNAEGKSLKSYGFLEATNSLGFRDYEHLQRKDLSTYRIIVLGDSVAAGLWTKNRDDIFPAILESDLNAKGKKWEVLNFSVPGYNTQQEVETLKEKGLKFKPDLVILAYCLNDRMRNDADILESLLNEQKNRGAVNRTQFQSVLCQSALFRFVRFRALPVFNQKFFPQKFKIAAFEQDTVADAFAVLASLSREHRFQVLVAVFPEFAFYDALKEHYHRQIVNGPDYHRLVEHEEIRVLSQDNGFYYLDLLPSFIQCEANHPLEDIALDRYHLRPLGHRCASDALRDFIQQNSLFSSP